MERVILTNSCLSDKSLLSGSWPICLSIFNSKRIKWFRSLKGRSYLLLLMLSLLNGRIWNCCLLLKKREICGLSPIFSPSKRSNGKGKKKKNGPIEWGKFKIIGTMLLFPNVGSNGKTIEVRLLRYRHKTSTLNK